MSKDYKKLYKYYNENYKRYTISFHKEKEKDLIEKLESKENITEFIKEAIIEKENKLGEIKNG